MSQNIQGKQGQQQGQQSGKRSAARLTPAQRLEIVTSGLTAGHAGQKRLYGAHSQEAVNLWYDAYDLGRQKRLMRRAQPVLSDLAERLGMRVRSSSIPERVTFESLFGVSLRIGPEDPQRIQ